MTQLPLQEKELTDFTKQKIERVPPFKEATDYPPMFPQDLYIC